MSDVNKAVVRRFVDEVYSRHDLGVADEIVAADVVDHAAFPGMPPGREGVKALFTMFHAAFPDRHMTIEDLIAEGDKVVARVVTTGTHQGQFMGIPATGVSIEVPGVDIYRLVDGEIVELWSLHDRMALMTQLGVIPPPS